MFKKAKCYYMAKYEDYGESNLRRILDSMSALVWLLIPWAIYMVVLAVVNEINCTLVSMGATLVAYIILLAIIRKVASSMEEKMQNQGRGNADFTAEEIASIFEIFLCASAFYFSCRALFGMHSVSAEMAIANMTLYIGFVVSLENLVRKEVEMEQKKKAFIILKPFYIMNINSKHAMICGGVLMVVSAASVDKWGCIVLCALVLLFVIAMLILVKLRKARLAEFGKKVSAVIEDKTVLFLQIGTDYVVKDAIVSATGVMMTEWIKVVDDTMDSAEYDVVIIMNSLANNRDNMYLPEIRKIQNMLAEDGVIIDPFITRRKKRSFVYAWLGIPRAKAQQLSAKDYFDIFNKKK